MRRTLTALVTMVFALGLPRVALACPVCFGASDSPMALGVNMGIYVLLGVTAAVLAGFASFFIYLMRRARAIATEASGTMGISGTNAAGAPRGAEAGSYGSAQEGTA